MQLAGYELPHLLPVLVLVDFVDTSCNTNQIWNYSLTIQIVTILKDLIKNYSGVTVFSRVQILAIGLLELDLPQYKLNI